MRQFGGILKKALWTFGIIGVVVCAPAWADPISLQEIHFNLNGTQQENDYTNVNAGGFNTTTGIGTLTWLFNPGSPGAYFFDVFFDHQLGVPFFNEYASVHGVAAAGQSWQIGDPASSDPGSVFGNTTLNALNNTNGLPGTSDNFLGNCAGAACNGDVAMAMGFNFVLGAGQQALVTLNLGQAVPAGFYLQQTHPVDANNQSATNLYLSGNVAIQGACVGDACSAVPEPNMVIPVALLGLGIVMTRKRSFARHS